MSNPNVNNSFPNNINSNIRPIDGNNYSEVNNFKLYDEGEHSDGDIKRILRGINTDSDLSQLFFSNRNLDRIQKKLKNEIYNRTRGKYLLTVDQDKTKLIIVMRSIFLQKSVNNSKNIVRQTKKLNQYVVDDLVPDMITNIKSYYGYLDDINGPLEPIMRPVNVNNAGHKTLPSITTTFF
tara:strand:+ start:307 stop:846 length:540 start_codon:yes stop_codon:yes gene_type:complete